jgi:hypothetical protein
VPDTDAAPSPPGLLRGLAGVTVASILGNLIAYALLLTAARSLGTKDYASLVALMNVLLVGSVPAFALQAVVARRVAVGATHDLLRVSTAISVGTGLLFLALVPLEVAFLHLSGFGASLLLALAVPGITLQGVCQGCWQGAENFGALALTTLAGMTGRVGFALVGLLVGKTATSALLGLAIGVSITAAVCLLRLPDTPERPAVDSPALEHQPLEHPALEHQPLEHQPLDPLPRTDSLIAESSSLLVEAGHAAHAYGVFLLLSVSDLLLASHVLDTRAAAVYAAGSVMAKAALWLPQSAANVLFASMTDATRHRGLFLRGALAIAGLGVLVTLGCLTLSELVTLIVAGHKYPELHTEIWLFAGLGSCLALIQFALVSGLAIRAGKVTIIAWVAIAAEAVAVLGWHPESVRAIVAIAVTVNLVAAGAALALRSGPTHETA